MLKPAASDPNYSDAMERFRTNPDDFGPQEIMPVKGKVVTDPDNQAAFQIDREKIKKELSEEMEAKLNEALAAKDAELKSALEERDAAKKELEERNNSKQQGKRR
jgi:hypothetical protein